MRQLLNLTSLITISGLAAVISGCTSQEIDAAIQAAENSAKTSSSASSGQAGISSSDTHCEYTMSLTYELGLDPTVRGFVSRNVSVTETVESSTCADIATGDQALVTADEVSRNGSQVQIQQSDLGALGLGVWGTNLNAPETSLCNDASRITQNLISGFLDGRAQTMVLQLHFAIGSASCSPGPSQGAPSENDGFGPRG